MQEVPRQGSDWQDVLRRLAQRDLRQTALFAFAVGVLLHVFVIYAVLGSGGSGSGNGGSDGTGSGGPSQGPAVVQATPTPSGPPDRTDCNLIRNTQYRSETERQWFLKNCTGG